MPRRNRGRRGQRRTQRAYWWFRCKQCNRHWESSHVYRVIGTLIVPFGQACKICLNKQFTGPYRTECIRCKAKYCYCGKSYDESCDDDDDDNDDHESDDDYGRERHVDSRKRHEEELCERCQSGWPCG